MSSSVVGRRGLLQSLVGRPKEQGRPAAPRALQPRAVLDPEKIETTRVGMGGEEREIAMPPLQMEVLDADTFERLLMDIEQGTELISVLVKQRATGYATGESIPLSSAREMLLEGRVKAIQIRYRLEGTTWCDTLLSTPEGVRLVRVELPNFAALA